MTIAEELRALAERAPADGPPAVTRARWAEAGCLGTVSRGTIELGQVSHG
jgi:hypothetical protein